MKKRYLEMLRTSFKWFGSTPVGQRSFVRQTSCQLRKKRLVDRSTVVLAKVLAFAGQMSVSQMFCDQMFVSLMSCDQTSCGQMSWGELYWGEMYWDEMYWGKMSMGHIYDDQMS
jgi:hypothetical protein